MTSDSEILRQAMSIAGRRSAAARREREGEEAYRRCMAELGRRGGIAGKGKARKRKAKER
jgi:hypothetical protein